MSRRDNGLAHPRSYNISHVVNAVHSLAVCRSLEFTDWLNEKAEAPREFLQKISTSSLY